MLLQLIPLGIEQAHALAILREQGVHCTTGPSHDEGRVGCQSLAPGSVGYTHWTIDLKFDDANHLTASKVAILNILF